MIDPNRPLDNDGMVDKTIGPLVEFISDTAVAVVEMLIWSVNTIVLIFIRFLRILTGSIRLIMKHIPRLISPFVPDKTKTGMNQQLIYAGVEMTSEEIISITLVYSIVVMLTTYFLTVLFAVSQWLTLIVVVVSFGSVWAIPFVLLNMLSMNRSTSVETTLPDVLTMVAQNIQAGMTSYNALWNSARPEFGPLAVEIQDVAKATLTGMPLMDALMGMTNHINSIRLERAVRLMIQGMKSGGELPTVLYAIAKDMRGEDNLKKQMAAETSAQSIFILFAIVIGAPMLFAVSSQFITIFSTMMEKLNVDELAKEAPQSMVSLSALAITPSQFQLYALATLAISAFFASLFMGVLRTGRALDGITTIPALVIVAICAFIVMKIGLDTIFSGMMTF